MTEDWPGRSESNQARRRAAIALTGIVVAAVVVAVLMFTLAGTGTPTGKTQAATSITGTGTSADPVGPSRAATSSAPPSSVGPPPAGSATAPVKAPSTTSCTPAPCVLTGDPGNVVAAVNVLRATQGQPAVTGSASVAAANCAVHSGNAPFCAASYYWVPLSTLSGADVVTKISGFGSGRTWLLNPRLTKVAVGWAESAPGQYECAVYDVSLSH